MGGIHPTTLVSGREADVEAQVHAALQETGGSRLILAPTGPLPPRARPELVAALQPTFASIWIGNNDVLAAATSGIVIEGVTLTPAAQFEAHSSSPVNSTPVSSTAINTVANSPEGACS